MSAKNFPEVLKPSSDDIRRMLACHVHVGTRNADAAMVPYVWGRKPDGM
jgi:hypothetical protein